MRSARSLSTVDLACGNKTLHAQSPKRCLPLCLVQRAQTATTSFSCCLCTVRKQQQHQQHLIAPISTAPAPPPSNRRHRHHLPVSALHLLQLPASSTSPFQPRHSSRVAELCTNSAVGANGPKLRDSLSQHPPPISSSACVHDPHGTIISAPYAAAHRRLLCEWPVAG